MSCLLARRLYLFWDCVIASSCADHCPSVQVSPWQRLGVHKNVNKYLWHWWLNSSLSTLWAFNLSWFGVFECPLEWQVFYKSAAKGQRPWNYWIYIPLIVKWIRNMILPWARFGLGSSELMARKLTTEPRQRPNAGPVRMTDCEGDFFVIPFVDKTHSGIELQSRDMVVSLFEWPRFVFTITSQVGKQTLPLTWARSTNCPKLMWIYFYVRVPSMNC